MLIHLGFEIAPQVLVETAGDQDEDEDHDARDRQPDQLAAAERFAGSALVSPLRPGRLGLVAPVRKNVPLRLDQAAVDAVQQTDPAAPSLTDGRLGTDGLSYVLTSRLGEGLGRVLLCDVALAVAVATLAIQTSATRMLFSMARDRALPFSGTLSRVSPRTGQPPAPALVVGVLSAALLLLSFSSAEAWLAISTTCIVMLYLAYAMVTGPLLLRRLRGELPPGTDESGNPVFSLGRWGIPVNTLALLYGLAMTVNLAWPRAAVYDPSGGHWYFQWFSPLFVLVTLVLGFSWRALRAHREHSAQEPAPAEALP